MRALFAFAAQMSEPRRGVGAPKSADRPGFGAAWNESSLVRVTLGDPTPCHIRPGTAPFAAYAP